jgi:hypothetical protein
VTDLLRDQMQSSPWLVGAESLCVKSTHAIGYDMRECWLHAYAMVDFILSSMKIKGALAFGGKHGSIWSLVQH